MGKGRTRQNKKQRKAMRLLQGALAANGAGTRRKSLYFAYGSNLHQRQMRARCPLSEPLRPLVLKDWRLVFRGVADIEPCHRDHVQGALYVITPDCERRLDRYEGYPRLYRKEYFLIKHRGEVEEVMFYRMNHGGVAVPSPHYYETIAEGFDNFGLDHKKLVQAARRAIKGDEEFQSRLTAAQRRRLLGGEE